MLPTAAPGPGSTSCQIATVWRGCTSSCFYNIYDILNLSGRSWAVPSQSCFLVWAPATVFSSSPPSSCLACPASSTTRHQPYSTPSHHHIRRHLYHLPRYSKYFLALSTIEHQHLHHHKHQKHGQRNSLLQGALVRGKPTVQLVCQLGLSIHRPLPLSSEHHWLSTSCKYVYRS